MRFEVSILLGLLCVCPLSALATQTSSPIAENYGLQLNWLNTKIQPSANFYKYANETWQQHNTIPPAYPSWGTFNILDQQTQNKIKNLIEVVEKSPDNSSGSTAQKVGDFYYSGMDTMTINKMGAKPLQSEFDRISQIKNLADLQRVVTHLQMIGVDALFGFGQMQDLHNSNKVIGVVSQGGLGLPDRDYYLKDDDRFQQIRQAYINHVAKTFELLGDETQIATNEAKKVLSIETILAKASMSRIEQRDPIATYHMMDHAQLNQITPNFSWKSYFTDVGHPEIQNINLATPGFFKELNTQLKNISLEDWKIYLRWHLIDAFAPYLSQPFEQENFRMTSMLTGAKELHARWQRVVNAEDEALGFAIGKLYVEKYFPPSSKIAVEEMLNNIRTALKADLQNLAWMTPETRKAAVKKLDMMGARIGYPDKWWDYSTLKIDKGPYVLNVIRATEFLNRRELNKIGKPVDSSEWEMTPQTINAYYDPSRNNLNIPAGILQPPFFDPKAPAAINYGAIGFVMGHEMTHGFDDQGAKFDGHGNLNDWWKPEDLKKFQTATQCIDEQFSGYTVGDNIHLQGKLLIGEATADLGGLTLAYHAFHASDAYKQAKTIAGFTPDQQFFLSAAHIWAANIRPEQQRHLVITDPHPPAIYRVNGTLANMPQFQEAFHVTIASLMIHTPRCVIW